MVNPTLPLLQPHHQRRLLIVLLALTCAVAEHGQIIALSHHAAIFHNGAPAAKTFWHRPDGIGANGHSTVPLRGGSFAVGLTSPDDAVSTQLSSTPSSTDSLTGLLGPSESRDPLKVLFLSADTGGGHRASAESLASQFLIHFPGSTYDLLDIWTTDGVRPYSSLVPSYKHLSAHPRQWRFLYHLSNSRPWEIGMDFHSTVMCERRIRRRIASYNPDVVVSVHPAMNHAPLVSLRKIAKATGKHIPFFTVVTDLGSGHCTWFHRTVDKMYLASDRLRRLAKRRGRTPDSKIVMTGLPIRNDFAVEAAQLGDRTKQAGQSYQTTMKQKLGLGNTTSSSSSSPPPMILVMGGGEGVGSLAKIVDELYTSFTKRGVDATICVVCGRNEKLQQQLAERDWATVAQREQRVQIRSRLPFIGKRRRSVAIQKALKQRAQEQTDESSHALGKVQVVGLGFITNMADYMVAADVLVTKAGPGTIAEAAAVGLPIMLTSFLPGQEAGNVDYVVDFGFGDYCEDPVAIAEEVAGWLRDPSLLEVMSHRAQAAGRPNAASEIVLDIGSETHVWKALNGDPTVDATISKQIA